MPGKVSTISDDKKIGYFLLLWLIINAIHAYRMDLNEDEAYYWMYSQFLDVGYFDHPPIIAYFIKAGDLLFHSTLSLRLMSVLASTFSIYILWKTVKPYSANVTLFCLLYSCFFLFNLYGFIATPDSPLFFFTVLFFYGYQQYVKQDNFKWVLYLSIVVAGLLYSKYHGVLVLLFTLLSNVKLTRRFTFWLIVIFAAALYSPHILWQAKHGYPTIAYQLFDRSANAYRFTFTTEFILGQLIFVAPLVGWYLLIIASKVKPADMFMRAVKFTFYGIFIFFLISTLKGRVQAHWTLIGHLPVFILSYIYLSGKGIMMSWLKKLIIADIILLLLIRFIYIVPIPAMQQIDLVKKYTGNEQWAKQLKEKAGENFVVFNSGFQEPSEYNFYNNTTKGFSYNSRYHRQNQYDIWPIEDSIRGKRIFYVSKYLHFGEGFKLLFINFGKKLPQDSFTIKNKLHYGQWIDDARLYQKIEITAKHVPGSWKQDETKKIELTIFNPYKDTVHFSNTNQRWKCYFEYAYMSKGDILEIYSLGNIFEHMSLPGGDSKITKVNIKAPSQKGNYKLIFSIRTDPFPGTRNSRMIGVNVK